MDGEYIPTVEELRRIIREQLELRHVVQEQQVEIARLRRQMQSAEPTATNADERRPSRWSRVLSRGQLFKAGAMGLVGLAGAEVTGALQEQPAFAYPDNIAYEAAGGTGLAFYQPGDSTGYGYETGAYLYGQQYGVHAEARDASGTANNGIGVFGGSGSSSGVQGDSDSGSGVQGASSSGNGVFGISTTGNGIYGQSDSIGVSGYGRIGVFGRSSIAAVPPSNLGAGIYGTGVRGTVGVLGVSDTTNGVEGTSTSGAGVRGISSSSIGVYGTSTSNIGVYGGSTSSYGVEGRSTSSYGGVFTSTQGVGTLVEQTAPLSANNTSPCLLVSRIGTNSSGNAYNYSGALIYGNDSPSNSGGGSTPASSGPLLQLVKSGATKCKVDGSGNLVLAGGLALNGASATGRPTITGSKDGNAALASLLSALAALGLITDSTT